MSVEARRACGYRKVGGLYLTSEPGTSMPCCKLPILLKVCPTCNAGIKQSRGWQWIDPRPWLGGQCSASAAQARICPLHWWAAADGKAPDRVGLIWIGTQFYQTPQAFLAEDWELGISRRIKVVPRDFKLGETWVFLAHPHVQRMLDPLSGEVAWTGGVFRIFKPTRIEKIITRTQAADSEEMARLAKAGITPVIVPDNDRDHQGTVYDKDDDEPTLFPPAGNGHEPHPEA